MLRTVSVMTRSANALSLVKLGSRGGLVGVDLLGVGVDLLSVDVDMLSLSGGISCATAPGRARKIRALSPPSCPTDDSNSPRTRGVDHNVYDSFRSRAYTANTGVELNRIERHGSQTANKGLRHNVLRYYKIEANRPAYEYRCAARELADVAVVPRRC